VLNLQELKEGQGTGTGGGESHLPLRGTKALSQTDIWIGQPLPIAVHGGNPARPRDCSVSTFLRNVNDREKAGSCAIGTRQSGTRATRTPGLSRMSEGEVARVDCVP
jgi:hypothetical protein